MRCAVCVQIALTQDLLELFIEYQIPSDLLTYDEGEGAAPERKLAAVSEHVAAIHSMLAKAKAEELRQAEEAKEMARLEAERELAERRAREEEMMECMEDLMSEVGSCEMADEMMPMMAGLPGIMPGMGSLMVAYGRLFLKQNLLWGF